MDALKIPTQNISNYETIFDKVKLLNEAGLHLAIDKVNWPNDFPKLLPVTVHIAHDNQKLYLYYQVEGEQLRAANTKDFGSVWEDSCVEFFVQRKGEKSYRNFEFNVLGVLLAAKHEDRETAEKLSEKLMSSIQRFTTIKHHYQAEFQLSDWTLYAEIPKEAFGFLSDEKLSGQTIGANFYKCGDETSEPHFISWNPIGTIKPDFHVPQYFGELTFE
ncbi:MAG: carbohydrate-binding family 9-like protein [Dysgonamonadaceae bacterium]|jgi:hypothetical protein|nr:carbohydrate-binding family 9-like protein [Dysgonamonadaceae bacterium]MDD3356341.1 carbohydrate-binding family 9-like protein [Dysgonamonadaceae bacterium]MDD3727815.1 carbohydrate-binding family 9-like protein [Dysgonamonadaceae bacterium]MDD4247192.1 carbohydrate-binding family 9-like protein [Dysgonamonadaceae bacterium]MDD4605185.1 carbohydrate-binding family 9-like protein [Dysgonamonadaceae bacterium]